MCNAHPIDLDLKYTDEGVPPFLCSAMADGRLYVFTDIGESGWANVAGQRPPTVALVNRQEIRFGVHMRPTGGGGWEYSPIVYDFAKGRSIGGGEPTRAAVKAIVAAVQAAIPGWLEAHPEAFTSSKRAELEHRLGKAYEEAAEAAIRIRKIEAEIAAL